MRLIKCFSIAMSMLAALILITGTSFAADPLKVGPAQKVPLELQKKPLVVQGVGPNFSCSFKPWSSGLPAGGPLGGTGLFNYGMSMSVKNTGSTKFYGVHGNLVLKVNGTTKNKTCSLPSGVLNNFSLDPGKSASHNLNCGTESNVTTSTVTSGSAYVQSNDGKKFNCTLDTSVPVVK